MSYEYNFVHVFTTIQFIQKITSIFLHTLSFSRERYTRIPFVGHSVLGQMRSESESKRIPNKKKKTKKKRKKNHSVVMCVLAVVPPTKCSLFYNYNQFDRVVVFSCCSFVIERRHTQHCFIGSFIGHIHARALIHMLQSTDNRQNAKYHPRTHTHSTHKTNAKKKKEKKKQQKLGNKIATLVGELRANILCVKMCGCCCGCTFGCALHTHAHIR